MFGLFIQKEHRLMALLFILTGLTAGLLLCCAMPETNTPQVVKSISADGQITFSDGSIKAIPHYGDPNYLVLFAVRHCEKAKDGTDNPDLTPEGRARAEKLGQVFDNARIDRMWSTSYKRTIQTAETVKRYAGDPPIGTFPPNAQNDWLMETLASGGGQNHFYVGHQNTVPQLANALTSTLNYKNIPDNEFGLLFILITSGVGKTEVLEYRY